MTVRLPNGERLPAISLGGSELSDAGMLKITQSGSWPFAKMAPRGSVSLGDWCFGLGHPGGYDEERGIVVRIGRVIGNKNETMQTDSRLLGGDSGGPLFDFDGQVIAIHSRISKKPDENFHVPIESFLANWKFFQNSKLFTIAQMEKGGFLGVSCKETEKGLIVVEAIEGTVAEKSGLRPNDVILAVDGESIDNREELTILLASKRPSDEIKLEYGGKKRPIIENQTYERRRNEAFTLIALLFGPSHRHGVRRTTTRFCLLKNSVSTVSRRKRHSGKLTAGADHRSIDAHGKLIARVELWMWIVLTKATIASGQGKPKPRMARNIA